MNAEKFSLTTDAQGYIVGLPQLEPNQEVELIVLFPSKETAKKQTIHRTPPAELVGKVRILANVIAPVVDEAEWDALQ